MSRFRLSSTPTPFKKFSSSICLASLMLTLLISQSPRLDAVAQQRTTKRSITHNDYDSFRSIQAQQISRNGRFVAYAFMPQDGDGEIVVLNLANGQEWRAARGYRPPLPPPDDPSVNVGEVLAAQARLVRPMFTADSRFVVFSIEPTKDEMTKAKKAKKNPEEMPKNAMGILDLSNGAVTRVDKVKNFQVPEDGSGFIAYLLDGKDWNSYSVADGKVANLTATLNTRFADEQHDSPSPAGSYGTPGWTKDDRFVLIYDRYDIWQISPDGREAKNLTDGPGRREKITFRYVRLDPKERFIDPSKPLLLRAENENTRDSGFYRDKIDGGMPERLVMAAKDFTNPTKAKDADTLILTASRFDEFPDLWVTSNNFRDLKKITNGDA